MASWMKRFAGFLAYAIAGESKAYGFTLVIWATGTAAIGQHGYPNELRVLLFVLGALSAFLVTIAAAFPDYKAHFHRREEPPRYAYGQFHLVSVLLSVGAGWLAMRWAPGALAFYLASLAAVGAYELLLTLEIMLTTPEGRHKEQSQRHTDRSS